MAKIKIEKIKDLRVASLKTKKGININGIYVPNFEPELQAALGATLSRDPSSAKERLKNILNNPKIKNRIMDVYFKNYGHNSIGDMGFLIFSIEGSSMLGGFSCLENRLFNGQEASTRYIDFEKSGFVPIGKEVDALSKKCFNLYKKIKTEILKKLISEGVKEKEAEPQAFDIAGAFLPISARTNIFWVGSIRTYIDQTRKLKSMDGEFKEIGEGMENILKNICPNSVKNIDLEKNKKELEKNKIFLEKNFKNLFPNKEKVTNWESFNLKLFLKNKKNIEIKSKSLYGNVSSGFSFDFRSIRDIHRHRAFSLNTIASFKPQGVEKFYLEKLPENLKKEVEKEVNEIIKKAKKIKNGHYAMPMAIKFKYLMMGNLDAWLYFLYLRSGAKVHPTVISIVQKIGKEFEKKLSLKNLYQRGSADYEKRSKDANKI